MPSFLDADRGGSEGWDLGEGARQYRVSGRRGKDEGRGQICREKNDMICHDNGIITLCAEICN